MNSLIISVFDHLYSLCRQFAFRFGESVQHANQRFFVGLVQQKEVRCVDRQHVMIVLHLPRQMNITMPGQISVNDVPSGPP